MSISQSRRIEVGAERRGRMRRKLLEAAARVVAEHGEQRANIDDFIQAAGVARGTFYNYYSTRAELLNDLWSTVGRTPFLEIQDACRILPDPAERLAAEARLVFHRAGQQPAWGWLVYAMSLDKETVTEDLLQYPRPDLTSGRAQNRFRFDDLRAATDMVVGVIRTGLRTMLSERKPASYGDAMSLLLLKALDVPDADARAIIAMPLPSIRNASIRQGVRSVSESGEEDPK